MRKWVRTTKNESYEEFVNKFKPKKTTDDCYTPQAIYDVVREWVCQKYNVEPEKIVRPFWPGADYTTYEYADGCVVLDNPPFSILSKICEFYQERDIKFFLFAPANTMFSSMKPGVSCVICDCKITYENGAVVPTSFFTNLEGEIAVLVCPELTEIVNDADKKAQALKKRVRPQYEYPDHIVTSALLRRFARYGVEFVIKKGEFVKVRRLDAQKTDKKVIYGSGLLVSNRAATAKARAEEATERAAVAKKAAAAEAAERAAVAKKAAAKRWELSERERAIVAELGDDSPHPE